jgi:lipid-A-disaccharide synthase
VELIGHTDDLSVMGLTEGISSLPAHLRLLHQFRRRVSRGKYDAVLLVDYPGLHLRLAGSAASQGIPVVYYVPPQLWAWGRWRVAALRSRVKHVAAILPFEEPFFVEHGIPVTFVGHPLLDRKAIPSRLVARRALGISPDAQVLSIFPGSRPVERRRLWPVFRETALSLKRTISGLQVVIAANVGQHVGYTAEAETAMAAADVVLCKSGTTTLEAAIADVPMVVAYRLSRWTFAVARHAVQLAHVSLVNLIAGQEVVPEFLQNEASPELLQRALQPLFDRDAPASRKQREGLARVRSGLGSPGAAGRVAQLVLRYAA